MMSLFLDPMLFEITSLGMGVVAQACIPALWVAETGGSPGPEIKTILVNKVKPRLY